MPLEEIDDFHLVPFGQQYSAKQQRAKNIAGTYHLHFVGNSVSVLDHHGDPMHEHLLVGRVFFDEKKANRGENTYSYELERISGSFQQTFDAYQVFYKKGTNLYWINDNMNFDGMTPVQITVLRLQRKLNFTPGCPIEDRFLKSYDIDTMKDRFGNYTSRYFVEEDKLKEKEGFDGELRNDLPIIINVPDDDDAVVKIERF